MTKLANLIFENIQSDALELDFGKIFFNSIKCKKVKNDCLDMSNADVNGEKITSVFALDKGISIHGFESMKNDQDINLKKLRLRILKKNKNFSFTKGLLENKKLLNQSVLKFKPTIIIHLAAQAGVRYSIDNPNVYLNSNIIGTFNIIKIANNY